MKKRICPVCDKGLNYFTKVGIHKICIKRIKKYRFDESIILEKIKKDYDSYLEPRNDEAIKALRNYWDWLNIFFMGSYLVIKGRKQGAIAERIKAYQDLLKFDSMINYETATYLRTQIKLLNESKGVL